MLKWWHQQQILRGAKGMSNYEPKPRGDGWMWATERAWEKDTYQKRLVRKSSRPSMNKKVSSYEFGQTAANRGKPCTLYHPGSSPTTTTKQKKELMWGCSPPHFLGSCSDPYPSQMGMDQKWKPPPTKIDLHKLARICGRFKPLNFDPCRMYCPPMPGAFPRMSARGIQSTAVQPASSRYADSPWRGSSNGLKVAKRLKLQMTRTPTFSINLVGGLAQVGIDF